MAWTPLKDRLNKLPLIICGPILRRCEPDSVTVWVALKSEREVTLKVYSRAEATDPTHFKLRMVGTRNTVELGEYLHVIAVTAKMVEVGKELVSGEIYFYELIFPECEPNLSEDSFCLNAPDIVNAKDTPSSEVTKLHYSNSNYHQLPSFSLPPEDLNKLRIIHGSCRRPDNEGLDAMPAIDDMLIVDWPVANERPHMLFFTGDQIYADDLSATFLYMLIDAAFTLLGWDEELPDIKIELQELIKKQPDLAKNLPKLISHISPGKRAILKPLAGFTSADLKNHLMGLGEYYAMYLFTWSDVLWPTDLPDFSTIFPGKRTHQEHLSFTFETKVETKEFSNAKKTTIRLNKFRETLPNIRRALANVPTYMIFDDHDVTDDWYMSREWCEAVLKKPLGRRIVQNALLSYAVFQAWGNTPEQFSSAHGEDQPRAGEALLDAASEWHLSKGTDSAFELKLADRLGLPPKDNIFTFDWESVRYVLTRPSGALHWNFAIICCEFEVIFFDTRTRRSFSEGRIDPPLMLSHPALDDQLLPVQNNQKSVTIIVLPTPFIKIPVVHPKGLPWVARWVMEGYPLHLFGWHLGSKSIYEYDIFDHWLNQDDLFETILAKMATRWRTLDKHQSRVVILTGDVHFAAASRLQYQSDTLYKGNLEDPSTFKEAETIIAQFSSSAFKKQNDKTRFLHHHGYVFGNTVAILAKFFPSTIKMEWSEYFDGKLPTSSQWFGWRRPLSIGESIKGRPELSYAKPKEMSSRTPALVDISNVGDDWILKPHWRYRIDYILAENEVREPAPITPNELFAPSPGDRKESIKSYLKLAKDHKDYARKWGNGKEIVGVNNVGELSFDWGETNKSAIQTSWWRLKSRSDNVEFLKAFPLSKFKVSFEFEDSDFKMPEIPSERSPE